MVFFLEEKMKEIRKCAYKTNYFDQGSVELANTIGILGKRMCSVYLGERWHFFRDVSSIIFLWQILLLNLITVFLAIPNFSLVSQLFDANDYWILFNISSLHRRYP